MTDLSIFITVAGLCLSVATFYFGRQSVTKADGKAAGALETDLRYIKESVGRIEGPTQQRRATTGGPDRRDQQPARRN
ncbi:MAG: hypothetical protein ACLTCG_00190 [Escherichia coli]